MTVILIFLAVSVDILTRDWRDRHKIVTDTVPAVLTSRNYISLINILYPGYQTVTDTQTEIHKSTLLPRKTNELHSAEALKKFKVLV